MPLGFVVAVPLPVTPWKASASVFPLRASRIFWLLALRTRNSARRSNARSLLHDSNRCSDLATVFGNCMIWDQEELSKFAQNTIFGIEKGDYIFWKLAEQTTVSPECRFPRNL